MLMCWRDIEHRISNGGEVDHETVSLESNELHHRQMRFSNHILIKINYILISLVLNYPRTCSCRRAASFFNCLLGWANSILGWFGFTLKFTYLNRIRIWFDLFFFLANLVFKNYAW